MSLTEMTALVLPEVEALERIAGWLTRGRRGAPEIDWAALRYPYTQAIRAALAAHYAPATENKMLAALKGVLKAAWRLGLMKGEVFQRATDLPAVQGTTLLRGRALTAGELRARFAACAEDPNPGGRRDAALLAVLYGAGLRRSEVVALDVKDYDPATGAVMVHAGNGHGERIASIAKGVQTARGASHHRAGTGLVRSHYPWRALYATVA